jgi:hypothetical protein
LPFFLPNKKAARSFFPVIVLAGYFFCNLKELTRFFLANRSYPTAWLKALLQNEMNEE